MDELNILVEMREEQIKNFENQRGDSERGHEYFLKIKALECAIAAINDKMYRRADWWVSVEERLPDEYKEVEITDGKNVEIGMYTNVPYPLGSVHEWDIDKIAHSEINLKKITHWKEKPQPPKEGE